MSLLEAEKVEIIKFRDDTEREREQLLEQVWCQYKAEFRCLCKINIMDGYLSVVDLLCCMKYIGVHTK